MTQTTAAASNASAAADPAALMPSIVAAIESSAQPSVLEQHELESLYAGAFAELQAGRHEHAHKMFLFLNGQSPLDPRFAEALGITHVKRGDFALGMPFLALASYLRPTSPVPLLHMAEAMAGMGERRSASALLSASAALADLDPRFSGVGEKARARLDLLNGDPA